MTTSTKHAATAPRARREGGAGAVEMAEALRDLERATERVLRALRAGGGGRALERRAVVGAVALGLHAAKVAALRCADELTARSEGRGAAAVGARAESDRAVRELRARFSEALELAPTGASTEAA